MKMYILIDLPSFRINATEITGILDCEIDTCKMNHYFAIYSPHFLVLIPHEAHRCDNGTAYFMNQQEFVSLNEPIYNFANFQQQRFIVCAFAFCFCT